MMGVILVILIYQTFIRGQYSNYNYLAIVAFIIFLLISIYDMKNASE